jgi:hypothetical protein
MPRAGSIPAGKGDVVQLVSLARVLDMNTQFFHRHADSETETNRQD